MNSYKLKTKIGASCSSVLHKLLPKKMILTILSGKLKGMKWYPASADISCLYSNYEPHFTKFLEKELSETDIFYDIGANVGYYSLLVSKICDKVISFEPLPNNLFYIKQHLKLNNIQNVTLIEAAVLDVKGFSNFSIGLRPSTSHITQSSNAIKVKTVKIDELVKEEIIAPPTIMKIDIEGSEFLALKGASDTIKKYKPKIFLEIHGEDLMEKCSNLLKKLGYANKIIEKEGMTRIYSSPK